MGMLLNAKRDGCVETAALQKLRSSVQGRCRLLRSHRDATRKSVPDVSLLSLLPPLGQTQSKAKAQEFDAVLNSQPPQAQSGLELGRTWIWTGSMETVQHRCCKRDTCIEWDLSIIPIDTMELVSKKNH